VPVRVYVVIPEKVGTVLVSVNKNTLNNPQLQDFPICLTVAGLPRHPLGVTGTATPVSPPACPAVALAKADLSGGLIN
jgi:hypothetical protein